MQATPVDSMTSDEFNQRHEVGAPMHYVSFLGGPDAPIATATRSRAWRLASGEHVVMIEGITGCVSIDHLTAQTAEEKT